MANIDLYKQKLVDIADAIRGKNGETGTYTLEQMPGKIAAIPTGGSGVGIVEGYTLQNEIPKDLTIEAVSVLVNVVVATGYQIITVTKE